MMQLSSSYVMMQTMINCRVCQVVISTTDSKVSFGGWGGGGGHNVEECLSCHAPTIFKSVWVGSHWRNQFYSPNNLALISIGTACHQNQFPGRLSTLHTLADQ